MRFAPRLVALVICLAAAAPATASAVTLDPIASAGFTDPTYVAADPADPGRVFIVERGGTIVQVTDGVRLPFADISSLVSCCEGERGLLSMAVPPDFPETGRFYVDYAREDNPSTAADELGDIRVDELHAVGTTVPAQTPRRVLELEHSSQTNHNGGQLQFGPDGLLYISVGDGGGGGDPKQNGQNKNVLFGKILRINPAASGAAAYSVPAANPFVSGAGADEVYSYGLRNPWRFSFDRLNADMMIGDVGQNLHEEIDFAPSSGGRGIGANFGWNCREGLFAYTAPGSSCTGATGLTDPILDYPHADPGAGAPYGCSITGGYVVRDPTLTSLYGRYVYADFCRSDIRSVTPLLPRATDDATTGLTVPNPDSFGEDSCGRLYVAGVTGVVRRFVEGTPARCTTLSVAVAGDARGTVTGPGISCLGDCHETFNSPTSADKVTFTAVGSARTSFTGWTGACAGQGAACTVEMTADRSSVARFLNLDSPPEQPAARIKPGLSLGGPKLVTRGKRARLVAKVRDCSSPDKARMVLIRDGKPFGSRITSACREIFHPRINSAHRFKVLIRGSAAYVGDASGRLKIKLRS